MPAQMPARDEAVLKRRSEIVRALRALVPGEGVISAEREMRPYETDGLTAYRQLPMVVVLPRTAYSHSASLGSRYLTPVRIDNQFTYCWASDQLTLVIGASLGRLGFGRYSQPFCWTHSRHSPVVTGYRPI